MMLSDFQHSRTARRWIHTLRTLNQALGATPATPPRQPSLTVLGGKRHWFHRLPLRQAQPLK